MLKRLFAFCLLAVTTLPVWATDSSHIELLIFRQGDMQPRYSSKVAPDNWADNSQDLQPFQLRSSLLEDPVSRLTPANGYDILLHRIWQQDRVNGPVLIALSSGDEVFGHHPVEGVLTLEQDRSNKVSLDFWINQFKVDGNLERSERLQQSAAVPHNELTYIDYGDLGVLIRIQPH
jgi:hypothetical protein